MTSVEIFFTTLGMAAITLVFRAFFLVPKQDLPMPQWLRDGLSYAPVAALAAVVAPEVVMTQGHLIGTWQDARVFGALAGLAVYFWRGNLFATIACGTGVMLALRLGMGW